MRWRIVPLLMLFVGLAHFNRVSISTAGTEAIIPAGVLSEQRMGLVYSAFLWMYTLAMIPGGWFIDRFGPRVAWMVVGFGSAVGATLTGYAGLAFTAPVALWISLLSARSAMGLANAPLHPSAARLVANWVPPHGVALANGLVNGTACVGIAFTYIGFGWLMDGLGWPHAFLLMGGLTVLMSLLWVFAGADHPPGLGPVKKQYKESISSTSPSEVVAHSTALSAPSPIETRARGMALSAPSSSEVGDHTTTIATASSINAGTGTLLGDTGLLCLTISYAMVGYFQYLFFYWAQYYFEQVLKLEKATGRLSASLLTVAMGVGMVAGGWLSDQAVGIWGSRRGLAAIPVVGLLVAAVVTSLGAVAIDPTLVVGCFAVAMGAVGLGEGSYWMAAVRMGGSRGGTAAGVLNTGGNIGGTLAPALTPVISALLGWKAGLVVAAAVCLTGAILWWGVGSAECLDNAASGSEKDLALARRSER
jgi:MFS family permease